MNLKESLDVVQLAHDSPMMGFCEYSTGPSDSRKDGKFNFLMILLLKKDFGLSAS
jgi:hypothetical protein